MKNYRSRMDIEFCLGHGLSDLRGRGEFAQIEELHNCLQDAHRVGIECVWTYFSCRAGWPLVDG